MKKRILGIMMAALVALAFAGCSNGQGGSSAASSLGKGESIVAVVTGDLSGGVAAEVGDVKIGENAITAYINNFRYAQRLQNDGDWGQWIYDNGYTMDGLRSETVDYFVELELVRQAAKSEGVEVTDEELDQSIQDVKDSMSKEDFAQELDSQGLDEAAYRDQIYMTLLQNALQAKVAPSKGISDEYLLEQLKYYYPDDVAADVTTLDGIDQVKVDNVKQMLEANAKQMAFSDWMDDFKKSIHVETHMMPDGLPYVVDLTPYAEAENASQNVDGGAVAGASSSAGSGSAASKSSSADGSNGEGASE